MYKICKIVNVRFPMEGHILTYCILPGAADPSPVLPKHPRALAHLIH